MMDSSTMFFLWCLYRGYIANPDLWKWSPRFGIFTSRSSLISIFFDLWIRAKSETRSSKKMWKVLGTTFKLCYLSGKILPNQGLVTPNGGWNLPKMSRDSRNLSRQILEIQFSGNDQHPSFSWGLLSELPGGPTSRAAKLVYPLGSTFTFTHPGCNRQLGQYHIFGLWESILHYTETSEQCFSSPWLLVWYGSLYGTQVSISISYFFLCGEYNKPT